MTKSKPVAYCENKIMTTERSVLHQELENAPIKRIECEFMKDIADGMQYKELSLKYNKSQSRIGKWKREVCTKLLRYDMQRLC